MIREVIFRLTLGGYYLALGVWLGATAMMGAAAGMTFVTLRAANPVLPAGPAGNPRLAPHTADFLAGNVVNASFNVLSIIQACCAVLIVAAIALQMIFWRDHHVRRGRSWANALRIATVAAALALFAYDLVFTRTSMLMLRTEIYHHDLSPRQYGSLERDFQNLHRISSRSQLVMAGLMGAAGLLSPFVFDPRRRGGSRERDDG